MANQDDRDQKPRAAPPLASHPKKPRPTGDHLAKHATDLERIYTSLQPPHAAILSDEDTYIHNIVLLSCRITSSKRKPSS